VKLNSSATATNCSSCRDSMRLATVLSPRFLGVRTYLPVCQQSGNRGVRELMPSCHWFEDVAAKISWLSLESANPSAEKARRDQDAAYPRGGTAAVRYDPFRSP
jgi:hypothetical protein